MGRLPTIAVQKKVNADLARRTFIITSVIHFSENKLSRFGMRSVFTPEERTMQTIKTVNSIREKIPGATIILVEMGNEKNLAARLISTVDKYLFIGDKRLVKWAANGKLKGMGEAIGLIASAKEIQTDADFYFKISGRYFLNENFDPEQWNGNLFIARNYEKGISTRLYGFGKELFADWQKALRRSLPLLYIGRSIEDVLPVKFGRKRIHGIASLGVAGYIAPDGGYLAE
jgi:hypothetical protein